MWWYAGMGLFGGNERAKLLRWLRNGDVRLLLLPADPGQDQMLEYIRLFNPQAQLAPHGSINVDGLREIYLSRGYPIDPDIATAAEVPDGLGVAYFVSKTTRAQPLSWSDVQQKDKEQVDASFRLVRGLAIRLGGTAWPETPVLREPLEARVYAHAAVSPEAVHHGVAKYARGLAPYRNVTLASMNVSAWRAENDGLQAELWPQGKVGLMLRDMPRSMGDWYARPSELSAIRLELATPANQAEPATARLLGECALDRAGSLGGKCVDQLGFRATRPEDLVFG